jgi:hypothetical protein
VSWVKVEDGPIQESGGRINRLLFIALSCLLALPTRASNSVSEWPLCVQKTRVFLEANISMTYAERSKFMEMCWKGSTGEEEVFKALSWICIQECNNDYRLRHKYGWLGGHESTILKGASHIGEKPTKGWLKKHPEEKTRYLAVRFLYLYNLYGRNMEKTCRVWNQGKSWKGEKAASYWDKIQWFKKKYERIEHGDRKS